MSQAFVPLFIVFTLLGAVPLYFARPTWNPVWLWLGRLLEFFAGAIVGVATAGSWCLVIVAGLLSAALHEFCGSTSRFYADRARERLAAMPRPEDDEPQ